MLAWLFLTPALSFSATIYVDVKNNSGPWNGTPQYPFKYIQDGIHAASQFDTVQVAKGIYNEDINLYNNITLISENGAKETYIVGSHTTHVVYLGQGIIDGFTIGNGGCYYNYKGSGIYCAGDAIIRNNIIKENDRCGIEDDYLGITGTIIIRNNTITKNDCTGVSIQSGG